VGLPESETKTLLKVKAFSWCFHCFSLYQPFPLGTDSDNPVWLNSIGSENTIADLEAVIRYAASREPIKRPKKATLSPHTFFVS
jgi:hypothetical protein